MIKILFLAANPLNTEPLRLDEEIRSIDSALRQAEFRDQIALHSHWAVRIGDLQELFLRYQPNVVHFSGHGSSSNEIVLQDNTGHEVSVSVQALSSLFSLFEKQVRCVLLNACFSMQQATAIGEYIDSVIGMSDAISDQAATQFATAFYRGIGYGQDVQSSFNLACSQLNLSNTDEAHMPQLLGKLDASKIKFGLGNSKGANIRLEVPIVEKTLWWRQIPEFVPKIEERSTKGDVIIATIGTGSRNVVGKNIHQVITDILGNSQPDDRKVIDSKLTEVKTKLNLLHGKTNTAILEMANFQLKLLEGELTKTDEGQVPSASTITQVGNWLLENIPGFTEALTGLFATPAVGRVIGKAGEIAVNWIQQISNENV